VFKPSAGILKDIAVIFTHAAMQPAGPRIYAIGASILGPGGERRTFTSLIDFPRLTGRERYVSGISEQMMENAPGAAAVSAGLRTFLGDRSFFFALGETGSMEGIQALSGLARSIDLGFSAEFFLPHLRGYNLKSLWEYLSGAERDRISFTPEEGLDLSIDLVRHIAGHCLDDRHAPHAPVLRHFLKKSDTLFGAAFLHLHRHFRDYFGGTAASPSAGRDTGNWRAFLEKAEKGETEKRCDTGKPAWKIAGEDLDHLYAGLAASADGFTYRNEQVAYARHVAGALNDGAVLTIEAGTGTGKTLGYLLPAMEYVRLNPGERVVISTYTKNLQEQIFHNDIAFVRQVLPRCHDIRIVLLKGKTSYVCVEKLDSLYDDGLDGDKLLAWLYCLMTAFCFRQADIGAVGERVRQYFDAGHRFTRMLKEVSAGNGCPPSHTRCPAQVVTAQARASDLVVTNHHKLALLDRDPLLAGCFNHYIIDEANHFEPAVRSAFGQTVQSRDIAAAAGYLETRVRKIFENISADSAPDLVQSLEDFRAIDAAAAGFRETLAAIDPKAAFGVVHPLPYDHPVFIDGRLRSRLEDLYTALDAVVRHLKWLKDDDACRLLKIQRRTGRRIEIQLEAIEEVSGTLKAIHEAVVFENNITVYQIFRKHWSVAAQRVQVGDLIRGQIYEKKKCIVFTAATICDRGGFATFREIAGMTESLTIENAIAPREFRFARIPSPFPRDAMEIVIPPDAASGRYDNKASWIQAVARVLPDLIRENQGRTLVLFSSYQDLEHVFEKIGASLEDLRYPILVQRPGQSTVGLCDEFRAVKESVLFGVDTFWYGVDFKGDTLTQVVITRIPYPPPNDPVQAARRHALTPREFWNRYRYDTDIKMKQGIGRLIRCETDRGRVVILDSRYKL